MICRTELRDPPGEFWCTTHNRKARLCRADNCDIPVRHDAQQRLFEAAQLAAKNVYGTLDCKEADHFIVGYIRGAQS